MSYLTNGLRDIASRLGINDAMDDTEESAIKAYGTHHWGLKHDGTTFEDDHPDAPDHSTDMGKLIALGVIPIGSKGKPVVRAVKAMHKWEKAGLDPNDVPGEDEGIAELWFSTKAGAHSIISFTPASEMLHLALSSEDMRQMKHYFRDTYVYSLETTAQIRGGRAAEGDVRQVEVALLGELAWVMYRTDKKGDGISDYVHGMGTEGRLPALRPYLCIAADGSLWIAGGNYEVKTEGISG